ncbi:flagellar filament capping protein FliD [Massilia sp. H-1]|nr:flagellar filament capping protein FliD [Massilia sp. H-1]
MQNLQTQLRKQLTQGITGLTGDFKSLSQVGISFQKDGTLSLDNAKLDKAIKTNFKDVAGVFAAVGKASDSLVQFQSSTAATKPGEYGVNITALATKGTLLSDNALAPTTTIAANTTWSVTLNETDPVTANRTASFTLAVKHLYPGPAGHAVPVGHQRRGQLRQQ